MSEREILALYAGGGFVIFVIAVNILFKLLGIKIKETGTYYKAYLQVAEAFNLTELDLTIDERYAKVDHIERLRFTRIGTKKVLSVFEGAFQESAIELLDIKKGKTGQETLIITDFNPSDSILKFQCNPLDHLGMYYKEYREYGELNHQHLELNKKYKGKNPANSIWLHLSADDRKRLNELATLYREFEVIIENGKFNFLMERQKIRSDRVGFKFVEADCRALTLIVELALELRDMFANAAAALELENK